MEVILRNDCPETVFIRNASQHLALHLAGSGILWYTFGWRCRLWDDWEAIDAGDHLTAWACLATQRRARQGLAYFTAEWQCIQEAHVVDIRPMPEVEITRPMAVECQMLQVQVDLKMTGDCFYGMSPGPFTVLARETPDGPWLIDSFNTGP